VVLLDRSVELQAPPAPILNFMPQILEPKMTKPSRQVSRYHARLTAKKAETAALHEKLRLPPIRVQYDPLPLAQVVTSKYMPHAGAKEVGRYV
jgi:hypothetical protein